MLTPLAAPAPFELWLADLSAEPAEHELGILSVDEHERAGRFVFARDRRRFLAAHLALRQVLSARTGLAPHALSFIEGPFGKPKLAGITGCAFNLSHSDDVALIAVADSGEIGVDVELLRVVGDAHELAERNFTAGECVELANADAPRDLAFLRGWTRKEACLKAIGSGLSIAPETFEAGLAPVTRVVRINTPAGTAAVEVYSFEPAPGIVGALARLVNT